MIDYSLRRLRYFLFTLYDIHKDCIQTCENLEILTEIPASTLYDELKYKISLNDSDLHSNFLSLITKCNTHLESLLSRDEESECVTNLDDLRLVSQTIKIGYTPNRDNNFSDKKELLLLNGQENPSQTKLNQSHSYIHNPTHFFNSEIGTSLKNFCGHFRIANFLQNHRVLIPFPIFELSRSPLFKFIISLDEFDLKYNYLLRICKLILNTRCKLKSLTNHRIASQIFVQCSGQILYNQIIKSSQSNPTSPKNGGNWSKMVVYRKFIFFKGRIRGKNLISKTVLESLDTDKKTIWAFLKLILFNSKVYSEDLNERKEFINSFFNSNDSKNDKISNKKTILYSLFSAFSNFVLKLNSINYEDKKHLATRPLKGTNLNTVSVFNVYQYVKSIVQQAISPELLCGKSNYLNFLKVCYSVISLNKGENLSMSEVMKHMNIKDCTWSKSKSHSRGQTRTILEYLCKLIFFLLQYFIIPLVGRHLHITECGFSMYRIHYIRNEDWTQMVNSARSDYLSNGEICKKSNPSDDFPKLRFVPKQYGMRPILNCNTTAGCREFLCSLFSKYNHKYHKKCRCYFCNVYRKIFKSRNINSFLKLIHQAFTVNCKEMSILGNGVLGYNSFYRHLKSWWLNFTKSLQNNRDLKLYYFIADLSRCYERIPHDKLMSVLNDLPLADSTFRVIYKRFFVKHASRVNSFAKIEDVPTFNPKKVNNLANRLYGNSIIASKFQHERSFKVTKFDIMSAVSALISSQNLQLPNLEQNIYMKVNRGIPQGCCISPLLSSFYLASLDRKLSSMGQTRLPLNNGSVVLPNLLVRWIDDFLFVSTNREDVDRLSKLLCSDNFGAMINPEKIITNTGEKPKDDATRDESTMLGILNENKNIVGASDGGKNKVEVGEDNKNMLEWINCRFNFDIENRFINVELVPWKFPGVKIRDTICLSRWHYQSFMFSVIEQRLVGYISNKLCHKTYTCVKINSPSCIISNSYIVMRTCSLKLKCAIKVLLQDFGGFVNFKYLQRLIANLVAVTSSLVAKGGLNTRKCNLNEILMISLIHTFRGPFEVGKGRKKGEFKKQMNKKIISKLYHHIKSCSNQRELFAVASKIEERHRKKWSQIM